MEGRQYKSPVRKLSRFFEKSRDGWKRKCVKAKAAVKQLTNRVHSLEKSREHWKEQAKQYRDEARQLQQELEKQKQAVG